MDSSELPTLGDAIRHALALRESVFLAVQTSRQGLWLALTVVALAGLSQALGQSLVLFINHVRPRRFILAVLFAALSYVLGYALWTASVYVVGVYAFGARASWAAVAAAVGLSYAPQLFAFFELAPFLGGPIGIGLSLWSLLAILISLRSGLGLELWEAAATAGLGWLLLQIWRRTLGVPIYALGRWLEGVAAGVPMRYRLSDVPRLRRRPVWLQSIDQWRQRLQRRQDSSD
jgi:hypothetical protein